MYEEQPMKLSKDTRGDLKLWLAIVIGGSGAIFALGRLGAAIGGSLLPS
jgi:hypothetical protein